MIIHGHSDIYTAVRMLLVFKCLDLVLSSIKQEYIVIDIKGQDNMLHFFFLHTLTYAFFALFLCRSAEETPSHNWLEFVCGLKEA